MKIDPEWPKSEVARKQVLEFIVALQDVSNDLSVRRRVSKVLGEIGDARAIKALIAALRDKDAQEAAAEALRERAEYPALLAAIKADIAQQRARLMEMKLTP